MITYSRVIWRLKLVEGGLFSLSKLYALQKRPVGMKQFYCFNLISKVMEIIKHNEEFKTYIIQKSLLYS